MKSDVKECPWCGQPPQVEDGICSCFDINCPGYTATAEREKWNARPDEWIGVEERMPEDGVDVLVRHDAGHDNGHRTAIAHRFYSSWQVRFEYEIIGQVFCWMPMPAPPKIQGGNG